MIAPTLMLVWLHTYCQLENSVSKQMDCRFWGNQTHLQHKHIICEVVWSWESTLSYALRQMNPNCNWLWSCVTDDETAWRSGAGMQAPEVLLVSELLYSLLSVSKATETGKMVQFSDDVCSITSHHEKLITRASRTSNLYYVNCQSNSCQVNTVREMKQESKESIWHQHFGNLNECSLQKLARLKMPDGFDYNPRNEIVFCVHWRKDSLSTISNRWRKTG